LRAAIQGIVATGGASVIIGTDALGTVTIKRSTGVGTSQGFLRWDSSSTKAEFSNDGAVWTAFDDTVSSVLVKISATDTTPGYLGVKLVGGDGITLTTTSGGGDERLEISTDASDNAGGGLVEDVFGNLAISLATDPGLEFVTTSEVSVTTTSTGTVGTDISGAGRVIGWTVTQEMEQ